MAGITENPPEVISWGRFQETLTSTAPADPLAPLADADPEVRVAALRQLAAGGKAEEAILVRVARMLKDEQAMVRAAAIDCLSALAPRDPRVVNACVKGLQEEQRIIQFAAQQALTHAGPAAVPLLVNIAKDGRKSVRVATLIAVLGIGDPAVPALVKSLAEQDERGRQAICELLAMFNARGKPALPALEMLLQDSAPGVKKAATAAIRQIEGGAPAPAPET